MVEIFSTCHQYRFEFIYIHCNYASLANEMNKQSEMACNKSFNCLVQHSHFHMYYNKSKRSYNSFDVIESVLIYRRREGRGQEKIGKLPNQKNLQTKTNQSELFVVLLTPSDVMCCKDPIPLHIFLKYSDRYNCPHHVASIPKHRTILFVL